MNVFWVIYQHINGLFLPKSHLNTLLSTLLGSLELDKGTEKEGWVKKKLPGVQNHLTLLIGTQTMMLQGQGGFMVFIFVSVFLSIQHLCGLLGMSLFFLPEAHGHRKQ